MFSLGRNGVLETTGLEYAALMVFNRALPAQAGACEAVRYTINVSRSSRPASPAAGGPSVRTLGGAAARDEAAGRKALTQKGDWPIL